MKTKDKSLYLLPSKFIPVTTHLNEQEIVEFDALVIKLGYASRYAFIKALILKAIEENK